MYVDASSEAYASLVEGHDSLCQWAQPLRRMERDLVGRDREIRSLMATFSRAELTNVILLGPAGVGKTSIVQGAMMRDSGRIYLEVDTARMLEGLANEDELGTRLSRLFDEVEAVQRAGHHEIVLFIDEFHKIIQKSSAATEDLKPLLAASGTRGIRVVAATTYDEFRQWVAPNQALVERLQRLNVAEADHDMTLMILTDMCGRYHVRATPEVLEQIYTVTERYVPANAQPRKSILVLDAMIGWHRAENRPLDRRLLNDVLLEQEGVELAADVDPYKIKAELDRVVYAQDFATLALERRLQLCLAELNDQDKPQATMLFCGSTGSGKGTTEDTLIPVYDPTGATHLKRAGDIVPGDYVFARDGHPERVVGTFDQGYKDVYRVTLCDGRSLVVDGSHLWGVYPTRRSREEGLTVYSTETLIKKGLVTKQRNGRTSAKYVIPMNQAVQWPAQDYAIDPYVIGVLLGNGCMTCDCMTVSSNDEHTVKTVARLIGADVYRASAFNYAWEFSKGNLPDGRHQRVQWRDVLVDVPELDGLKSGEKFIPDVYKFGSIEQRWALVHGLFDTDGCVDDTDRHRVSYSTTSEQLALDVQSVLWSLGYSSTITVSRRDGKTPEYRVSVKAENADKERFFTLPRKVEIARRARRVKRQRVKSFDYVGIRSIEKLDGQQRTVCLYVADDEHLYQAGDFIVTHNTALAKAAANIVNVSFIRFDMTEFSQPSSVERFRIELSNAVWAHPRAVVLLDEIEKACGEVTRMLLPVLDDARIVDANGREVTFKNAYIILTTNAGSEIFKHMAQYSESDTGNEQALKNYEAQIRRSISETSSQNQFPPELLGRIDTIVPFQPLSKNTMRRIVVRELVNLRRRLAKVYDVGFEVSPRLADFIVNDELTTESDEGGARRALHIVERDITTEVSRVVTAPNCPRTLYAWVSGRLKSEEKTRLVSDARVRVGTVQEYFADAQAVRDDDAAGRPRTILPAMR